MGLFGTDGVRDIAGQGALTEASVRRLGEAIGVLLKTRPELFRDDRVAIRRGKRGVVIGRDTRESGEEIETTLVEGICAAGVPVFRAGVIPTPAIAYLARLWGMDAGIVISASHNPPEYNGIKLISPQGLKLPDAAELEMERCYLAGRRLVEKRPGKVTNVASKALSAYAGMFAKRFKKLRLNGLGMVVDCANGAASVSAAMVFKKLGARPRVVHTSPDGTNINVGCGATHLEPLRKAVVREGAQVGIAFDGDQDRCMLVDERGAIVDGDAILAMCAVDMKRAGTLKKDVVVATVMSNWGLEQLLRREGVRLVRAAVGDRYVADALIEEGGVLGGEQSGHIIFMDVLPTGDGMMTALRVLEIMVKTGQPLSKLAGSLVRAPQVLLAIPVRGKPEFPDPVKKAIQAAADSLKQQGRVLVRYSGTENVCRVMVEGSDEKLIKSLANQIANVVRRTLG